MSNDRDYVYTSKEWRAFRQRMIRELDNVCVVCHKEVSGTDLTLDHILPVVRYPHLMYEPTNIQVMCRFHNSQKRDLVEARMDYFNPRWVSPR